MTTLVTGAAGFIGSNFVRYLLNHSDEKIIILDALTYAGNLSTIADLLEHSRVRFVEGDITDRDAVAAVMSGCERVAHFAAESHVDRSIAAPDAFVATNCGGTNVLCDIARQQGVDRFLHVSTDEVYGSVETGYSTESDLLEPRSPYSASKAGSDLLALSYHETFGLPVVVSRSSNQYGPHQFPEKVIPLFVTNLIDGRSVPLYGDGLNVRDWCFVEDNCRALAILLDDGVPGEIYNIGAGNEVTNRHLTERLLALCDRDESFIRYVDDRLGHDRRYAVDTSKMAGLGWAPSWDLDAGLETTVAWYRQNEAWWRPLKHD